MNPNEPTLPAPAAPAPAEAPVATPAPTPAPQPAPVPDVPTYTPGISNEVPAPAAPAEPAPAPSGEQPKPVEKPFDYDEYLDNLVKSTQEKPLELPKRPTEEEMAKGDEVLEKFFTDLATATKNAAVEENDRRATLRVGEQRAWDDVFTKYPEIKESKGLRDTIHNIRLGAYQRGQALTPVQVADELIGTLHAEYKKGVNDTNVQTEIRQSQPMGGGTVTPPTPGVDYASLQTGGDEAAIRELEKLMAAGKI